MATPNMNLVELVPGVTPGPQYATDIVSNFSILDTHDHTTGSGVKIPTAGLNINADLDFDVFGLTNAGFVQLNTSGTNTNLRSIYASGDNLFFRDGSNNAIQITSSGGVNLSGAGNLGGVTGSAGVNFILASDAWELIDDGGDRARLRTADIRLYEKGATTITNHVELESPSSLAATYTLTFPAALPASTGYLASNSSGALSFSTADGIAANITGTGADDIAADITATGANNIIDSYTRATGTTVGARGVAIATPVGFQSFDNTSGTVSLTNQSVTITTSGRPVMILFQPSSDGDVRVVASGGADGGTLSLRFRRGTTQFNIANIGFDNSASNNFTNRYSPGVFSVIDTPSAGTYTYNLQASITRIGGSGTAAAQFANCRMVVYEL